MIGLRAVRPSCAPRLPAPTNVGTWRKETYGQLKTCPGLTQMYGPAVRCKRISSICRRCGLASMYPASAWSGFVLRAIMDVSARAFSLPDRPRPAIWVTRVRMRREDRSSISSRPLADLGGKRDYVIVFSLTSSFVCAVSRSFVPACSTCRAPRAGAVKAGRCCGHPQGSALTAPSTVPRLRRSG
jgi:hypothetical protein